MISQVIDVHARDVVQQLAKTEIKSVQDFNWIAQLRYYWETNDYSRYAGKDCDLIVKMITSGERPSPPPFFPGDLSSPFFSTLLFVC